VSSLTPHKLKDELTLKAVHILATPDEARVLLDFNSTFLLCLLTSMQYCLSCPYYISGLYISSTESMYLYANGTVLVRGCESE
jgi:hypothetical protein